jgi:hypothetical protein
MSRKTISELVNEYKESGQNQNKFKTEEKLWNNALSTLTFEEFSTLFLDCSLETNTDIDPEEFILYSGNNQASKELTELYRREKFKFHLEFYYRHICKFGTECLAQGLTANDNVNFKRALQIKINQHIINKI